jgi:uncharacterized lipoprotein NlpE involved in copper resistance
MTADDRMAYLAAQEAEAAAAAYRPEPATDTRTHDQEVMAAHQGQPSIAVQSKTHGAGLPAVDRGTP